MRQIRFQAGVTLIELMIALAIGTFLMIGAITVFMQSRSTFRVTESLARLQESGRFALDTLERDVRMAQYWGLTNHTELISGRATESPISTAGGLSACGATWVIDLDNAIAGSNNRYAWDCPEPKADAGSDTLVVRRAAENKSTVSQVNASPVGTLFVRSVRGGIDGQIFAGATPRGFDGATQELHQLVVNGYYVHTQSTTLGNSVPSLRMKTLVAGGRLEDHEVLPGVENLQIQFGIDTDPPGAVNRGAIDRYVNADDPLLAGSGILAVRVWLRIRAERIENGFTDTATYHYADEAAGPFDDAFRRIVVSRTIYLRNAHS
jgi:type IV pilus assembly protein PilW